MALVVVVSNWQSLVICPLVFCPPHAVELEALSIQLLLSSPTNISVVNVPPSANESYWISLLLDISLRGRLQTIFFIKRHCDVKLEPTTTTTITSHLFSPLQEIRDEI